MKPEQIKFGQIKPEGESDMVALSALERDFINLYQGDFPLRERPFEIVAERLGSTEKNILAMVDRLKQLKLISRFGPLYDAVTIGGGLTLAAIEVPESHYQAVTAIVNQHHQVAHNYRREHQLNMWFVLATEKPEDIASVIATIEKDTALKVYNFPKEQEFYIGLWLHLSDDGTLHTVPVPNKTLPAVSICELDDLDRKLINATQSGFSIDASPYLSIGNQLGISQSEVLSRLQKMLDSGVIRRIGAVPNHYRLGLTANGMTVWDVPDDKVEALGSLIGQLDFVSHCYRRPRHLPLWRYNLFAMVHGDNRDEVDKKVAQIKSLLAENCNAGETLFSSAILKKTGLRIAA